MRAYAMTDYYCEHCGLCLLKTTTPNKLLHPFHVLCADSNRSFIVPLVNLVETGKSMDSMYGIRTQGL